MSGDNFIGLMAILLIFGLIPVISLIYTHKIKTKRMDTLIKIVELGGNVDPEMMKMLSEGGGTYKTDYKWGLIWLAIGIPVVLGMLTVPGAEGIAFTSVPVFIGIAYLISGKYKLREPDR
jgi:hypothetical protein